MILNNYGWVLVSFDIFKKKKQGNSRVCLETKPSRRKKGGTGEGEECHQQGPRF